MRRSQPQQRTRTVIENYTAHMRRKDLSPHTIKTRASLLERFAAEVGGVKYNDPASRGKWLSEIGKEDLERWFHGRSETSRDGLKWSKTRREFIGGASWNKYKEVMALFVKWAAERGQCDPFLLDEVGDRSEKDSLKIWLTNGEVDMLLWACDDLRDRAMLGVAFDYALRVGSLEELTISDVDWKRQTIRWKMYKKRRKEFEWRVKPLTPESRRFLSDWLEWYARYKGLTLEALLRNGHWALFPRRHTGQHTDPLTGQVRRGTYYPKAIGGQPAELYSVRTSVEILKAELIRTLGFTREELKGQGIHVARRTSVRGVFEETGDNEYMASVHAGHSNTGTTRRYIGTSKTEAKHDELLALGRAGRARAAARPTPAAAENAAPEAAVPDELSARRALRAAQG